MLRCEDYSGGGRGDGGVAGGEVEGGGGEGGGENQEWRQKRGARGPTELGARMTQTPPSPGICNQTPYLSFFLH